MLVAGNFAWSQIPICWYNLQLHFQMFLTQMQNKYLGAKHQGLDQDTSLSSSDTFVVSSRLVHTTSSVTERKRRVLSANGFIHSKTKTRVTLLPAAIRRQQRRKRLPGWNVRVYTRSKQLSCPYRVLHFLTPNPSDAEWFQGCYKPEIARLTCLEHELLQRPVKSIRNQSKNDFNLGVNSLNITSSWPPPHRSEAGTTKELLWASVVDFQAQQSGRDLTHSLLIGFILFFTLLLFSSHIWNVALHKKLILI